MVGVLGDSTEGADTSAWAITLADLHTGWDPSTDPLPHEDADLQWETDGPYHQEGGGAEEGAMAM